MREPASPSLLCRVRMRREEGHLETLDLGPPSFQNGEKYAFVVQATQSMIICNSSLNCGNLSYRYIASPHEACCTRYGQSFTYVSMLTASQQRHTLLSLFYWRDLRLEGFSGSLETVQQNTAELGLEPCRSDSTVPGSPLLTALTSVSKLACGSKLLERGSFTTTIVR